MERPRDFFVYFGTDFGPPCEACGSDLWLYDLWPAFRAKCVNCAAIEKGPLNIQGGQLLPKPTSAVEARRMHEAFRLEPSADDLYNADTIGGE